MRTTLVLAMMAGCAASALGQAEADRARGDVPQGVAAQEAVVRYEGHRSVRVSVVSPRELMTVLALTDDVLTCEGAGIGTFDVRMSPEQYAAFLGAEIGHEVLIEDLQAHIDAWRAANEQIRQQDSGWYDVFRDLDEINARLDALVAAHPNLVTHSVIGESLEGRPIRMIRVTGPGATVDRPAMVINGTQHSRESLSPMMTVYLLEELLSGYASEPGIQALVDGIDFHIVPMVNPDGYSWVWSNDPMWRKNRREVSGSNCQGVDLNRNWGYQWGQAGSSNNPCNQTYRGTGPLSEPETQAIAGVVDGLGAQGRLRAHLDVHSYATKMLSPWGFTTQAPADLLKMNYLGAVMRDAITSHRGTWYEYGQGSIILYVVSGGARDHSYGHYGSMGWTIELPGTSFHPPASEILPVSEETTLGVLALAEFFLLVEAEGACCVAGSCITAGEVECKTLGGMYRGDGSSCQGAGCPEWLVTDVANAGLTPQGAGILLDLTAGQRDMEIVRIDTHTNTGSGNAVMFEIWTYAGSYVGNDGSSAGWVLHDTVETTSEGPSIPTALVFLNPLTIAAGETIGMYVMATVGGVRYRNPGTGGQTMWANDDLTLFSDRARSAPWAGTVWSPRVFAGSIHYTLAGACYANCDGSSLEPVLNVDDFTCFINAFAEAQGLAHEAQITHYANCDGSTAAPVLNVDDFTCFINSFAQGCP